MTGTQVVEPAEPRIAPASRPSRVVVAKIRNWSVRADFLVLCGYVFGGLYVTGRLWVSPQDRLLSANVQDHVFFEFVLMHAARVVAHGGNPLFASMINYPDGVNLMANTSVLAAAIPLAPITLLFGPGVSLAVLLVAGLAGTAAGWYWVLSRHLVRSRSAAAIGGAFCGFAPGLISHANGHPNLAAQFVIPFIVWRTMRLREHGNVVRNGSILGLLVTIQAFLNEELLLFAVLAVGLFVLVYGLMRRESARAWIRPFLGGLGVAALVAVVLLAIPLWYQFAGPQSYHGIPEFAGRFGIDLGAPFAFPRLSVAGDPAVAARLGHGAAEESTFFGWPLLALVAVIVAWLWRMVLVRALAAVGFIVTLLSLPSTVLHYGKSTGVPGPFRYLGKLPILNCVVPIRFGLVLIPIIAILLALAGDRIGRMRPVQGIPIGRLWWAALFVALVPLFPLPLPTKGRPEIPAYIASGAWRADVPAGRSMLVVPIPTYAETAGMRWSTSTGLEIPVVGGYFLGPGPDGGRAIFGPNRRPTQVLLEKIATAEQPIPISGAHRRQAEEDLAYWRTSVIVLAPNKAEDELHDALGKLFGPAELRGGVWIWRLP